MTRYLEVPILPCPSSFGLWQTGEANGYPWASDSDIVQEAFESLADDEELYELGQGYLPESIEDIRGSILNAPDRVFALVRGEETYYWGIIAREED